MCRIRAAPTGVHRPRLSRMHAFPRTGCKHARSTATAAMFANAALILPPEGDVEQELGWSTDFHKRYAVGRPLGEGSFGTVFAGIDLETGQEVAVKKMVKARDRVSKGKTCDKLKQEVAMLTKLQGPANIVELVECFEDNEHVMVVTEHLSGGDLHNLSEATGPLPERALALIAWEILQCIKACHECRVLYGDIKPANFVMRSKEPNPLTAKKDTLFHPGWIKAVDFGCSQNISESRRFSNRKGTPVYMAPEIFDRSYGVEVDMWSTGVSLYQLASRRLPFWDYYGPCRATSLQEVEQAVKYAAIAYNYGPWLKMSRDGKDFIASCLNRDPMKRISVDAALKHAWFVKQGVPGVVAARTALAAATQPTQHSNRLVTVA